MLDKEIVDEIFEVIKKADKILLVLHVSPDGDCVGSVLAMDLFLRQLGKKTRIISYSKIPKNFAYLPGMAEVEVADFAKTDLSRYDLFIALDIAQETMITKSKFPEIPEKLKVVNIDHHLANSKFGDSNLIEESSSTAEMVYQLFRRWGVEVDKQMANLLFLGIFTDTGCFQYPRTKIETFETATELMRKGADLNMTVLANFRSYSFKTLKYWGRVLDNMRVDESRKFVWSKVSAEEIRELGLVPEELEGAASLFCPVTVGTEFGIILDENEGFVKGSLRSRAGFDVSKIAQELGGGGHKEAAGFTLKMSLGEAEKLVLETARKLTG